MEKKLIYTTFKPQKDRPEYNDLLFEWIISLRTLGKYKGEILVFDYSGEGLKNYKLEKFNVKVVELDSVSNYIISNKRNIDVIPLLETYKNYLIAHFDMDIWFQKDINPMFNEIEKSNGMYLAVEPNRSCNFRNGPEAFLSKYNENMKQIGGFVFGGFCSGRQEDYMSWLVTMQYLFDQKKWDIETWGADQSIYQYIVDPEEDNLTALKWCASHYLCEFKNGLWYLKDEPVGGLHLVGFGAGKLEEFDSKYRFKKIHSDIYNEYK